MEVVILPTAHEVGQLAAAMVADLVTRSPRAVLGVATGSSPLALYADLADRRRRGTLDLSGVQAFALDEYVGLPVEHPQSYASIIREEVTKPLRLDASAVHVPDGAPGDIEASCAAYEAAISSAGGIDLQILGIGSNGHIGFNEPTSSFASRTRIKTLAPQTRLDNARFFATAEEVPRHCVTQGLGTISEAKKLVLLAQGKHKAQAVAAAVEGPMTSMCPASLLQMHQSAVVILDEPAASDLASAEDYRYFYEHKPDWQRVTQRVAE